jgi:hypothetical protein
LLQRTIGNSAVYEFTSHEQYVRVKLSNGSGQAAWTQPVYTERLNPTNPVVNGASLGNEPGAEKSVSPDSVATAFGIGLANSATQPRVKPMVTFPTNPCGHVDHC